jgi:hypothetical protein
MLSWHRYEPVALAAVAAYERLSGTLPRCAAELAYVHVPLPEFATATIVAGACELFRARLRAGMLPAVWRWLPGLARLLGHERVVGCSRVNTGLFAALVRARRVRALSCGHNHFNDFVAAQQGVRRPNLSPPTPPSQQGVRRPNLSPPTPPSLAPAPPSLPCAPLRRPSLLARRATAPLTPRLRPLTLHRACTRSGVPLLRQDRRRHTAGHVGERRRPAALRARRARDGYRAPRARR